MTNFSSGKNRTNIWYKHRMIFAFIAVMAVMIPAMQPALAEYREFEPDEYTLFLAHFETLEKADYATGISSFAGTGARLTEGYYGSGIDLCVYEMEKDFLTRCTNFTPYYSGWGFHARGNVDPAQGTFECWFKLPDPKAPKFHGSNNFLNAEAARSVRHPQNKDLYIGFGITLNTTSIRYFLPTLAGNCFTGNIAFAKIDGFSRSLNPDNWHYFALTWSQGETAIWIDGRPLASFDMSGQLGLVLLDNPVRYLSMFDCIIDELRISNTARYTVDFEPGWRDGKRPAYAFTGNPSVVRYDTKPLSAAVPCLFERPSKVRTARMKFPGFEMAFARSNGQMVDFRIDGQACVSSANGLLLYSGLERRPLAPRALRKWKADRKYLRFEQVFEDSISANNDLSVDNGTLVWRVTLKNGGKTEAWLEPLMSIPAPPMKIDEFFDGCEPRRSIHIPRHRQEYFLTLPFVAAAGDRRFIGVGIDPHTDINDIVSEWIPAGKSGVLRQGTKIALSPGESFTYKFYIVKGASDFGVLDAIAAYHALFPDLYRMKPDVPVYSYLPATQDFTYYKYPDMKRMGYTGGLWGHGPGHDKGDEYGTAEWWNNSKFMNDYHYSSYTLRLEKMWKDLPSLRKLIPLYFGQAYNNYYPVRRAHICPDLTPEYIINELWPGHTPNEDPLCMGQYYSGKLFGAWIVNEYNTPLGKHFREQTLKYFDAIKSFSPGFINDFSHAGSFYRHNDSIAQVTPGRSFSRDLGTFVRKDKGRRQRYEAVNNTVANGHRGTFWSDGGIYSHVLTASSASIVIEGAGIYKDLTGPLEGPLLPGRFLIGEKPFSSMTKYIDLWTGLYVKPEMFTPETLRDLYRYCDEQLSLFCIKYGVTLDPAAYFWGRQVMWERVPVIVEGTVLGRKIVPAARAKEPLWVRRSGEGLNTFFVIGNITPGNATTNLQVLNRYFPGAPLLAAYYGGEIKHAVAEDITTVQNITVEPRGLAAFKTAAILQTAGAAQAVTRFSGDGITLKLEIDISASEGGTLNISDFGPVYVVESIRVNGSPAAPDRQVSVLRSPMKIEVSYRARSIAFNTEDWTAVELIKDGSTNFCIVADKEKDARRDEDAPSFLNDVYGLPVPLTGFQQGTAMMLVEFIEQYDDEDGLPGTLDAPEFLKEKEQGYSGWTVFFDEDRVTRPGLIKIDRSAREIRIEGATQGEIRRAMAVFMRLVDRKYPHVGRFFPMKSSNNINYEAGKRPPLDKWGLRKWTQEFFEKFSDTLFLVKPILRSEYEYLYNDNNMDFAGKYTMRRSPYIFEPTYSDDFVYGYDGTAAVSMGK